MDLDRYNETLDFASSPNFKRLTENDQSFVIATYENAYRSSIHMGQGVASGKAVQTALALIEKLSATSRSDVPEQKVPASIFAGLENCQ
jgi:hypothetical protein